jgi:hypothetical protein
MFSHTSSGTRRVRTIGGSIAAAAVIAAFTLTAASASAAPTGTDPAETVAPSISGTAIVGNTLTGNPGTWTASDASTVTLSYEWTDDTDTYLSSDADYQVPADEAGHQLTFTVFASDTIGGVENDNSDSASTGDVPVVDFHNNSLPVLTGGTVVGDTLTGTDGTWSRPVTLSYDWGISYGQSGDQTNPADPTNTHVVTNSDQDGTLVFVVTASDSTGTISVSVAASGVTIPAPPVADDSGLTAANEGGVTGSQTKTVATVTVPAPAVDGDTIYVYGYSSPTPIGFFTVSAAHTIAVPLTSLSKGLHKLALINGSGVLVGWLSVTAGGGLASTGVNVNAPLEMGGAGLLILLGILSVVFVTRQRRMTAAL